MQLLRTHDGMVGWREGDDKPVRWCTDVEQLKIHGILHWGLSRDELEDFSKEVDYALAHMAETGDTVAYFGIAPSFMFSRPDAFTGFPAR